jgi:predicted enzyme related to lactoylglutathione lyase
MDRIQAQFVGVELYFENLELAKKFYLETMGLEVSDEQVGHHAKFDRALVSFALNARDLSPTLRKIRRFSSLKCPT